MSYNVGRPLKGGYWLRSGFGCMLLLVFVGCQTATGTNGGPKPSTTPRPPQSAASGLPFRVLVAGPGVDDGATVKAKVNKPNGLDLDAVGNLYIADSGSHRIRKLSSDGVLTTLAGSIAGFADGVATAAQFRSPFGVAIKRDGTVYVADTKNHRIRAIAPDGAVTTVAGTGEPGYVDGEGASARFDTPFALALDVLDALIVADTGNHRIRRIAFSAGTAKVETLAGGSAGYVDGSFADSRFAAPSDVALDERGRIYVADLKNNAIRILNIGEGTVRTLAGAQAAGDVDGEAAKARFHAPTGLTVDSRGAVFVIDSQNQKLKRVDADGQVQTISRFESGKPPIVPTDVAVTTAGAYYVSDVGRSAIWVYGN